MRVFLDTNVIISAFATRGIATDLFRYVLTEHELLTGAVNLTEVHRVMRNKLRMSAGTTSQILQLLREQTVVPKPRTVGFSDLRDRDDRWVLASAVAGTADVLITGDRDLLEHHRSPIPILDPRTFWNLTHQTA